MKLRYIFIPIIIITLIIWFINVDGNSLVNKEITGDNIEINYPYFNDKKIDDFIDEYLNKYKNDNGIIDYDNVNNKYYVIFYRYIFNDNIYSYDIDSFIIDLKNSTISKIYTEVFDFDIITNDNKNNNKLIALTFDDGPNFNTNKVLDVLNKYNAKATFFVLGSRVKDNKKVLKREYDSGMEIGNHTFNHLLLTKYNKNVIESEINNTSNIIFETIGKYPTLLRPSYGTYNNTIKKISNMPIIIWDVDTLDWKYHNSKKIANRVFSKVKDGDIILMHDIYSATANSLNIIIPELQNKGYVFVTVSELFYYKEVNLEKGKVYGYAK